MGSKAEGFEMPIYEYRCDKCQKIIEVMQKFSDKPLTKCPSCAGRVSRIISNCSFQLKGSGWYVTDYKKGDSGWKDKKDKDKEKGNGDTAPKTDTPKTDVKEAKKETPAEAKTA
jgi:putative FmdB family regulatory protein